MTEEAAKHAAEDTKVQPVEEVKTEIDEVKAEAEKRLAEMEAEFKQRTDALQREYEQRREALLKEVQIQRVEAENELKKVAGHKQQILGGVAAAAAGSLIALAIIGLFHHGRH